VPPHTRTSYLVAPLALVQLKVGDRLDTTPLGAWATSANASVAGRAGTVRCGAFELNVPTLTPSSASSAPGLAGPVGLDVPGVDHPGEAIFIPLRR
jgi:hypothetical protein